MYAEVARLTEKVTVAERKAEVNVVLPPVYTSMGVGFDKARQALRIAMEALDEEEGFREDAGGTKVYEGILPADDGGDYILSDDLEEAQRIAACVDFQEQGNHTADYETFKASYLRMAKYWDHVNGLRAQQQYR